MWRDLVGICGLLAAVFLAAMMLLTVADVVLRAVFNAPIRGVYELVELLLAYTFFLALPAVFLRDENIVVNVVDELAPRRVPALKRIAAALAVVVLAVMAWQGWLAAARRASRSTTSPRTSACHASCTGSRSWSASSARRSPRSPWDCAGRPPMSVAAIGFLGVAALLLLIFAARADRGGARRQPGSSVTRRSTAGRRR